MLVLFCIISDNKSAVIVSFSLLFFVSVVILLHNISFFSSGNTYGVLFITAFEKFDYDVVFFMFLVCEVF